MITSRAGSQIELRKARAVRHPKDHNAANPRIQCSACGKWKRENGVRTVDGKRESYSRFYACGYGNGPHLCGDTDCVCDDCCQTKCREAHQMVEHEREYREREMEQLAHDGQL